MLSLKMAKPPQLSSTLSQRICEIYTLTEPMYAGISTSRQNLPSTKYNIFPLFSSTSPSSDASSSFSLEKSQIPLSKQLLYNIEINSLR